MSSHLPQDVVLRILSRLPPKSLLRCRSVCKSWLSLIGSADYVSNNLLNDSILTTAGHGALVVKRNATPTPETKIFSFLSYETLEFASQTPENLPIQASPGISVVGCCHGLICLYEFFAGRDIFVWNPATSELKALPSEFNVNTVCFGFDHKRNEFKVLRFSYVPDDPQPDPAENGGVPVIHVNHQAEVYSLRSGSSWRKLIVDGDVPSVRSGFDMYLEVVPDFSVPSLRPDLAYANGVCYWRTFNHVEGEKVIAFHFTDEVFRATPLPDATLLGGHTDLKALTVLNESVGMIVSHNESFDIWVLLEFGVMESWTRLLRVENFTGLGSPLGLWKKGELFMENSEGELVLYDRSLQTVRNLRVKGMKESLQVFGYTPSLISIEGGFKLSE